MSETNPEQEKLSELENKITVVLEQQLDEAVKKRDAIIGSNGLKPPKFWTHQAEIVFLTQQINRRKNR